MGQYIGIIIYAILEGTITLTLTGWIIYNGFLKSEKFIDYATMLSIAAHKRNHKVKVMKNNEIMNVLSNNLQPSFRKKPDYILFTDKDIYLAKRLESLHIPVFNCANAIEVSDDKIKTYQQLAIANLPIPETIIAPKTFQQPRQLTEPFLETIQAKLGFPLIIKEAFGSFGEQVYLVHTMEDLVKRVRSINEPFMFQQFIHTSYGQDIRLQVVGNEVIAAIKRVSDHDFRANVTSGGRMEKYNPSKEEIEIAVGATKAIGADFAGVDILFGRDETPIICEVNSNAHIRNLYQCTGINVANDIILHIEKKLIS